MRKWRGFADNGACPIDPTGGGTCWKEGQASLITESALSLLGENLGVGGRRFFSCRPAGALLRGFHPCMTSGRLFKTRMDLGTLKSKIRQSQRVTQ